MDSNKSIAGEIFIHEVEGACPPLEAFCRFASHANVFFSRQRLACKRDFEIFLFGF